jgi:hypothetical protein
MLELHKSIEAERRLKSLALKGSQKFRSNHHNSQQNITNHASFSKKKQFIFKTSVCEKHLTTITS